VTDVFALEDSQRPSAGTWNAFLSVLSRRRRCFIGAAVLVFASSLLGVIFLPKTYTASAYIIVHRRTVGAPAGSQADLERLFGPPDQHSIESYVALVQSPSVAAEVLRREHIDIPARQFVERHVSVSPLTNTDIIRVSVSGSSAALAARLANEYVDVAIERDRELAGTQASAALGSLSRSLRSAKVAVARANAQLAAYEASHKVADSQTETTQLITSLSGIDQKIDDAAAERARAGAEVASFSSQASALRPTVVGQRVEQVSAAAAQLQQQSAATNARLQGDLGQLTPENPEIRLLRSRLSSLQQGLASVPQTQTVSSILVLNPLLERLSEENALSAARLRGTAAQVGGLENQRAHLEAELARIPYDSSHVAQLTQDVRDTQSFADGLQSQYYATLVAKTAAVSDMSAAEPANAAFADSAPKASQTLAVSFLLALVVGLGAAFAADALDRRIETEDDLERAMPVPLLAAVPNMTAQSERERPWIKSAANRALFRIAGALRYAQGEPRTACFVSPHDGDGKSTLALNVAAALGDMTNSVLLIDGDMRKPSLHEMLAMENAGGLSEALEGTVALDHAVRATAYRGLDLLTAGSVNGKSTYLLQSDAFSQLLRDARRRYRFVIVDSPAFEESTDALAIATRTDCAVLVVGAGTSSDIQARDVTNQFATTRHITILGSVLNRFSTLERAPSPAYSAGWSTLPMCEPMAPSSSDRLPA
jgi:capsular exopolysaccharide synthesis family protein